MSRIGNAPVTLPAGVSYSRDGAEAVIKGKNGELRVPIHPRLEVSEDDGQLVVKRPSNNRLDRSQHGLTRSLLNNAVIGVSQGYSKNLEIHGVGYRCAMKGSALELTLGFSHPVVFTPPEGIRIEAPDQTKIKISGIDKQLVGQVAANIRKIRSPDSYHGKGVRYAGEQLRLKPGKAAGK